MKVPRLIALTFVAFVGTVMRASAQAVAYNSFGSGNTYDHSTVWAVCGASISGGYRGQAEFFSPSISGDLSSIMLATYHASGSQLSNFYIARDNGSGTPGTILESFTGVINPTGLLTIKSTAKPLLQAGTKYWICDEPTASSSDNGWYYNNQGRANGFAYERSEWGWLALSSLPPNSGVFEVSVTPVPEPSAMNLGMLFGGCLLLSGWRRKPVVVS